MALRFGTDGVRGVANAELTPELALVLGRAARVLGGDHVVIGRDPRRSGPMLEAALAAGFASAGGDVELVGVVPTPAVAYLSDVQRCVGAVISASHNPFADNGIKLFAPGGRKLPDDVEEAIEAEIERELGGEVGNRPRGPGSAPSGRRRTPRAYADHLVGLFETPGVLTGLDIALDCANGATSALAPEVFDRLGARVVVRAAAPDGCNINDQCGATHPGPLAHAVEVGGFELGLAFDGDGDRLIAVDHTGAVVDGDHIIAICALDLHRRGLLRPRHRGRHRDDEPGLPPGHGAGRHPRRRDGRGRPLRPRGARGRRLHDGWRAERPCGLHRPGHDGRRHPHRPRPGRTSSNGPDGRWRSWPRRR